MTERKGGGLLITETDDHLARLTAGGNNEAFEILIHRYYQKVYAYCVRHVGSAAAAQDITQDVFLKLLQCIGTYRPREKFGSWLMTITVNFCRSYLKSAYHRHGSISLPLESLNLSVEEENLEEAAERSALGDRVRAALLLLPAAQREAILLRFYDDYSLLDIARITEAPLSTVKYRVRQACKRLKVLLKEDFDENN